MIWLVNDVILPKSIHTTIWSQLLEFFPDARFVGDGNFSTLPAYVEKLGDWPDILIRNGSYFRGVKCPSRQILYFQDFPSYVLPDVWGTGEAVFNSEYTKQSHEQEGRVIPVGVDFDFFRPDGDSQQSICWVGSGDHIKGYEAFRAIMQDIGIRCYIVSKHDLVIYLPGVLASYHNHLLRHQLRHIYRNCSLGVCTSAYETQHLAGLEMGACGMRLLASPVGIYKDRAPGLWGRTYSTIGEARALIKEYSQPIPLKTRMEIHEYWKFEGFDLATCKTKWQEII